MKKGFYRQNDNLTEEERLELKADIEILEQDVDELIENSKETIQKIEDVYLVEEQDKRISELEEHCADTRKTARYEQTREDYQDVMLDALTLENDSKKVTIANQSGVDINLSTSKEDSYAQLKTIKGNTIINHNQEPYKEIILNPVDINESNNKEVILEGQTADGGLIDVYLEGETLVNVSDTKEETLISSEKVLTEIEENTYQIEEDILRPSVKGNTLVNVSEENETLVDMLQTGSVVEKHDIGDNARVTKLSGRTMVNLCDQKDSIPLTKSYTVESGNHVALQGEYDGKAKPYVYGNTMVNLCDQKDPIPLTKSYTVETGNHVALEGEYDGKAKPYVYGNTMVNLCNQKDSIPLTKSYTVETGNHVALQGEYDGKAKPYVYGNTLVNHLTLNGDREISNTVNNAMLYGSLTAYKTDTIYTIIYDIKSSNSFEVPNNAYLGMFRIDCMYEDNSQVTVYGFKGNMTTSYQRVVGTFTVPSENNGQPIIDVLIRLRNAYTDSIFGLSENTLTVKDVIILEGDYTDKPIQYFEGLQSSFEEQVVPVNLFDMSGGKWNRNSDGENAYFSKITDISVLKPNTLYTVVLLNIPNSFRSSKPYMIESTTTQYYGTQYTFTTDDLNDTGCFHIYPKTGELFTQEEVDKVKILLLEGDYINYDFSDYDSANVGKYKVDYKVTGKNKCNNDWVSYYDMTFYNITMSSIDGNSLKVQGTASNILDIYICGDKHGQSMREYIDKCPIGTTLRLSNNLNKKNYWGVKNLSTGEIVYLSDKVTIQSGYSYNPFVRLAYTGDSFNGEILTIQLELGDTATSYEPYKEYIKTLYLNSPLLEGDSIEVSGNDIVHVHKYKEVVLDGSENWLLNNTYNAGGGQYVLPNLKDRPKSNSIVYCDKLKFIGENNSSNDCIWIYNNTSCVIQNSTIQTLEEFKTWLRQNPMTVVYELVTPTYEVISSNDNLYIDSYVNGHLDFDSAVPVKKVEFKCFSTNLTYLKPNTQYLVQFEADNDGNLLTSYIGSQGKKDVSLNFNKGLVKFNITNSEGSSTYFALRGTGANISNIVVTEAIDEEFGYFSGLQSSFEDGRVPENLITMYNADGSCEYSNGVYTAVANGTAQHLYYNINAKENTTYTVVANITKNTLNNKFALVGWGVEKDNKQIQLPQGFTGIFQQSFTTRNDGKLGSTWGTDLWQENTEGEISLSNLIIVEGDYSNYDFSDYDSANAGKYKVEYKVTGKNKFDGLMIQGFLVDSTGQLSLNHTNGISSANFIEVDNTKEYILTMETTKDRAVSIYCYDENKNYLGFFGYGHQYWINIEFKPCTKYIKFRLFDMEDVSINDLLWCQIEEGSTPTSYEPYKEYTKTLYLNSPLLEGDSIEVSGDNIYHIHRCKEIVFNGSEDWRNFDTVYDNVKAYIINLQDKPNSKGICISSHLPYKFENGDFEHLYTGGELVVFINKSKLSTLDIDGFKQWLSNNPMTVVYELATPYGELVSSKDNLYIDSYINGHLDFDSVIPIDKVIFKETIMELKYLKGSTDYTIQFESDGEGKIEYTWLGGDFPSNILVHKGVNIIQGTTVANPSEWFTLHGIGANISNVVVTEAVDEEFGYFEGLQSSFEDKRIPENLLDVTSIIEGRDRFSMTDDGYVVFEPSVGGYTYLDFYASDKSKFKPNTEYTIILDIKENTIDETIYIHPDSVFTIYDANGNVSNSVTNIGKQTGVFVKKPTSKSQADFDDSLYSFFLNISKSVTSGRLVFKPIILEGDYTNYDFSDYDSANGGKYKVEYKVTGKNKFDANTIKYYPIGRTSYYGVTTYNNDGIFTYQGTNDKDANYGIALSNVKLQPNTTYFISYDYKPNENCSWQSNPMIRVYSYHDDDNNSTTVFDGVTQGALKSFTTNNQELYRINIYGSIGDGSNTQFTLSNIQIEEGTSATSYEPYKEYTKTLYLNSPLLEGDSIEVSGNSIVHVHRYGKVVLDGSEDWKFDALTNNYTDNSFIASIKQSDMLNGTQSSSQQLTIGITDKLPSVSMDRVIYYSTELATNCFTSGWQQMYICLKNISTIDQFKQWLSNNPVTVVYELASPTKELISSNDNLYVDSYVNGHLDFNSVVPIDKVEFQQSGNLGIKYLKPSTEYVVQFEADGIGKVDVLNLGRGIVNNTSVTKGINKVIVTTPNEIAHERIFFPGIGCNISNIVVTEAVDEEFGYFEGMTSAFEDNYITNNVKDYTNAYMVEVTYINNIYEIKWGKNINYSALRPKIGAFNYKPNTTYTIIVDVIENTCGKLLGLSPYNSPVVDWRNTGQGKYFNVLGKSMTTITTTKDMSIEYGTDYVHDIYFGIWAEGGDLSTGLKFKYWVLEGDYTGYDLDKLINAIDKYPMKYQVRNASNRFGKGGKL